MNADRPPTSANPFCTRRVRPGALPFHFPPGQSIERLLDRLRQNGWWGEIVGPHGSGKSALLATLAPAIAAAGRPALPVVLHDGQRRLPAEFWVDICRQVTVDGYEQLGRWSRFRLKRFCRNRGLGLLVTAHASVGLPGLFRTEVDLEAAWSVVEQLQQGHAHSVSRLEVAERLERRRGDLRETLFDLYDLYELRRRQAAAVE